MNSSRLEYMGVGESIFFMGDWNAWAVGSSIGEEDCYVTTKSHRITKTNLQMELKILVVMRCQRGTMYVPPQPDFPTSYLSS